MLTADDVTVVNILDLIDNGEIGRLGTDIMKRELEVLLWRRMLKITYS